MTRLVRMPRWPDRWQVRRWPGHWQLRHWPDRWKMPGWPNRSQLQGWPEQWRKPHWPDRWRMRRLGLRGRVIATVAGGALLISAAIATLSYEFIRSSLLAERERTATRTAFYDATVVHARLGGADLDQAQVLSLLDTGPGRRPVLYDNGKLYALTTDVSAASDVPASLRQMVQSGQPGRQRVHTSSGPAIVVGIPLSPTIQYYEIVSQTETNDTLDLVGLVLVIVAAGTTVAGAGLGWYTARRALLPLASVAEAARGIAAGDLSARLDATAEPDLARLAFSFNNMVDQLSLRIERDRHFAADVSHELRSPLQTMAAAATVLLNRRAHLDQRSALAAELVADEVDRFQRLVTDLLTVARADAELEWSTVDVGALAREQCRIRDADPAIVAVIGDPSWCVDRRRLEQIVGNLVDNAQRHGGGATALRLSCAQTKLLIEVDDAGPGVLPEERELIFNPFVRGRGATSRGDTEGVGLGLAIVARLAESHGGRVTVIDRPDGGARFQVQLQRCQP